MVESSPDGVAAVEIDLSRDQIEGCADEAQLAAWFTAVNDKIDHIGAFCAGYREADYVDEDWRRRAGGKLGYLRLTLRWIERRMLSLDMSPPWPPTDPRVREVRNLERQNKTLKGELAEALKGKSLAAAAAEPAQ